MSGSGDPSHGADDPALSETLPDEALLDIDDPESWQAWHAGRTLLQHFGGLFHSRMDAYMSAFAFLFVVLVVSVLIVLIYAEPGEANIQLIYSTLFIMVLIGVPIVIVLILLMNANWQFVTDKHMISHACTGLRYRLVGIKCTAEASPDDAHAQQRLDKMQSSWSSMEMLLEQLDSDEKANPLRFMFIIPITYEFVGAWIAAVGAAATYTGTLFVQTLADQYSFYYSAVGRASNASDDMLSSVPALCDVPDEYPHDAGILHLVLVSIAAIALVAYLVAIQLLSRRPFQKRPLGVSKDLDQVEEEVEEAGKNEVRALTRIEAPSVSTSTSSRTESNANVDSVVIVSGQV